MHKVAHTCIKISGVIHKNLVMLLRQVGGKGQADKETFQHISFGTFEFALQ